MVASCVSPLRSGRRSSDMASRASGRLLRRLHPLVPRSDSVLVLVDWFPPRHSLCLTAPLGPTFVGHGLQRIWSPPVLHRSARADVRRTWPPAHLVARSCCTAPLGPTFVGHGLPRIWSPPPSAPPARPSLRLEFHRSARADVRRTWPPAHLVASSCCTAPLGPTSVGHDLQRIMA